MIIIAIHKTPFIMNVAMKRPLLERKGLSVLEILVEYID